MNQSLFALFVRFLRFGLNAWGGPVPQIAMLRHELVEREQWITPEKFNRVLAVYQVLPGPEAHELCCYFGYIARGRLGSVIAGLGFMLPGLVFMLIAAWLYQQYGLTSVWVRAAFAGMQCAAAALVIRAVYKLGKGSLKGPVLWTIAIFSMIGQFLGVHFAIALLAGAITGASRSSRALLAITLIVWAAFVVASAALLAPSKHPTVIEDAPRAVAPSVAQLGVIGLEAGLVTFGGAYTAIPVIERHAVARSAIDGGDGIKPARGWMTHAQFVDGLAIGGVLPAPLVIFSTFVGFLGAGFPGALAMTAGMFLPAFSFTLIGHRYFEKLVENVKLHAALDGVMSAVVGIIAVTAVTITMTAIHLERVQLSPMLIQADYRAIALVIAALVALLSGKMKMLVPCVVLAAGIIGLALFR